MFNSLQKSIPARQDKVAYFIRDDRVLSGHLVRITEPTEDQVKEGAKTLYEFGDGFSTPQIFATEQAALNKLNDRGNNGE